MAQIQLDGNNIVIGYALTGGFENGIDINGEMLPTDIQNAVYKYEQGEFVKTALPTREQKQKILDEIEECKKMLRDEDYKIIKCTEAAMLSEKMPYDLAELWARREAMRQRINENEVKL